MTATQTPASRVESARARIRDLMEFRESGVFLASDVASFISGAELTLTGGIELGLGPKAPLSKRKVSTPEASGRLPVDKTHH